MSGMSTGSPGRTIAVCAALVAGVVVTAVRADVGDAAASNPMIVEIMASNKTTLRDEDNKFSDWIEIVNPTEAPFDLVGWHLTDEASAPSKWTFPSRVLGVGQHVLVWASNSPTHTAELHATFALSKDGEYLALTDPAGVVVQEFAPGFPALADDISYGLGSNGLTGLLQSPTPGEPNTATVAPVAKPALSRTGGYIEAPVSVAVSTATTGATLRYTTDGSTPTMSNGTAVAGGQIEVVESTVLRVVAIKAGQPNSQVTTATYLVLDEVEAQHGVPPGWPATPVNGQVFEYGLDQPYVEQHRDEVTDGLRSLATVSIVTDQANLSDEDDGIYVNALNGGSDWERPASVELFDDSGENFQINAGVRIRGGYSRRPENPKHSFRLSFTAAYEGVLDHPVFGGGVSEFSSIDLRTEQNYSFQSTGEFGGLRNTMLREVWSRDSQAAAGQPATRSRYVNLFLNGQYWGMYMLQDRVSDAAAARQFSGSAANATEYDVLKHGHSPAFGYEVEDGDDEEWLQLWAMAEDLEVSAGEYAAISSSVDLESLATFMVINAYGANLDATPSWFTGDLRANNWTAVRGPGLPFQFYVTDAEHSLGAYDHDVDRDRTGPFPIGGANEHWDAQHFNPGWLHAALLGNIDYQWIVRGVAEQLLDGDGVLSPTAALARWNERKTDARLIVFPEAARWGAPHATDVDWAAEVDWVETEWFPQRTEIAAAQIATWYPDTNEPLPTSTTATTTSTTSTTTTTSTTSTTTGAPTTTPTDPPGPKISTGATGSAHAVRLGQT